MKILLSQNEKGARFVNILWTREHQLNVVVVLRSFVVSILLNVSFVSLVLNKNTVFIFFYQVEQENIESHPNINLKVEELFYKSICCQYND